MKLRTTEGNHTRSTKSQIGQRGQKRTDTPRSPLLSRRRIRTEQELNAKLDALLDGEKEL